MRIIRARIPNVFNVFNVFKGEIRPIAHISPPFLGFFPKKGGRGFFIKNRALSVFYVYCPLTSCKKAKKTLEPFSRTNGLTNGLTNIVRL